MTKDEVIRMAREAGVRVARMLAAMENNEAALTETEARDIAAIERFASLVAAAERERIKQANAPEIAKVNAHIKMLEAALADPEPERTPEKCIDILLERMNISELARAIGVDASAISHVKAGRYRITHYEAVDKLRSMV